MARTTLLDEKTYQRCLKALLQRQAEGGKSKISNRSLRELTGIGYDQAIKFFNRATAERVLLRKGVGSGTHYVIP